MPVFAMRHGAAKSVKEGSEAGRDFKSTSQINLLSANSFRWDWGEGEGGVRGGGKEAGWDEPSSAPTLSSPAKAHESGKLFQQLQVSEERNKPEMLGGACSFVILISGASSPLSHAPLSSIHHCCWRRALIWHDVPLLLLWVAMIKAPLFPPFCLFKCHQSV